MLRTVSPAYLKTFYDWSVRQYDMSGNMVGGFLHQLHRHWLQRALAKTEAARCRNAGRIWLIREVPRATLKWRTRLLGGAYTIVAGLVQQMGDIRPGLHESCTKNITQYTKSSRARVKNVARGEASRSRHLVPVWF